MLTYLLGKKLDPRRVEPIERLFRERVGAQELRLQSGLRNVVHAKAFHALFSVWPNYIRDDAAQTWLATGAMLRFAHFQFLVFVDGCVAGYFASVPLYVDPDCVCLPDEGYSWAIKHSLRPSARKRNTLCALAAVIDPRFKNKGLSDAMVEMLKLTAETFDLPRLIVPVRPTGKQRFAEQDMAQYLQRRTPEGLLQDSWLRSHLQGGAVMRNVCERSIVVRASKKRWQAWSNAEIHAGPNRLSAGLAPMYFDPEEDVGVYREPNVWVDYDLRAPRSAQPVHSPITSALQP